MNEPPLLPGMEPPPTTIILTFPLHIVDRDGLDGVTPKGYRATTLERKDANYIVTFVIKE